MVPQLIDDVARKWFADAFWCYSREMLSSQRSVPYYMLKLQENNVILHVYCLIYIDEMNRIDRTLTV